MNELRDFCGLRFPPISRNRLRYPNYHLIHLHLGSREFYAALLLGVAVLFGFRFKSITLQHVASDRLRFGDPWVHWIGNSLMLRVQQSQSLSADALP